ncbi:UDP-N-acetylglucosamine--peptide N-acetylglucosaminyltransferase 110 kDa subunit [Hondaea fermentalgiana]|uniref:UDP-N-acetylglucosamine--peptide N-acetylglucosaminyltransferase 110 kDa subunit n=1 Tax=Hondaea fermentalgiana TaxID=2315210 RepID=A0A2R5GUU0_9STRA|nr:UDP-N-acetylglucosamine--peptide N-acetylglucosaminyltransferase 110 kDa subunit [Hondaea fermentalgiana]|eukprot:GBG32413.1 UDP-N-acetylglucosamine--peptide N-acetylglucosaminyltransferase 110 kDa subunit [Hondaea fermentalgiana]
MAAAGAGDERDLKVLRTVYRALDTLQDDRVKRQDLLSIATKIHDRELLDKIRKRPWLQDLLQPERWGKHILRTSFSRTGSITCDAFITFWGDYKAQQLEKQEGKDALERSYTIGYNNNNNNNNNNSNHNSDFEDGMRIEEDSNNSELGTFTRRDTYGSIGSFGSAGTDFYAKHQQQQQQQLKQQQDQHRQEERRVETDSDESAPKLRQPPQGPRKILRALSVTSRGSSDVFATGDVRGSDVHKTSSAAPAPSPAVRVTIRANLKGAAGQPGAAAAASTSPPQVMAVSGTFEDFRASLAQRLGIAWQDDYIIIHSLLRAQVSRLEDIREGDQLEVARRENFRSAPGFEPRGVLNGSSTLETSVAEVRDPWPQPRKSIDSGVGGIEASHSDTSAHEHVRVKEISPYATFARRPSWKDQYDAQPLPSAVRHSIRSILKRVSTSSSRWQHVGPEGCCPQEDEVRDKLSELAASDKRGKLLSVEKVLGYIDKLGLQYGLGKNHARLLFVAVDQENTGTISMRHFQDMIMLWREVWAEHQAVLRMRAAEAEAEEQLRREEAAASAAQLASRRERDNHGRQDTGSAASIASDASSEDGMRANSFTSSLLSSRQEQDASRRPKTADSRSGSASKSSRTKATPGVSAVTKKRPFYSKISQATTHNKHMSQEASDKQKRILQARAAANKLSLSALRPVSAMPNVGVSGGTSAGRQRPPRTPSLQQRRGSLASTADETHQRPSTAPSVPGVRRPANVLASYSTEEDFLRAMHESKGENPDLLVGYASLLLSQVQRRSGCLHVPQGSSHSGVHSAVRGGAQATTLAGCERMENPLDAVHRRKMEKARQMLTRALSASKLSEDKHTEAWAETRAEILCKLGEVCELEGDASQARTLFHKAVRENPRSSHILCKYGAFLHKLGDTAGAKEYLLEALVHDRNCVDALLGYAILMSRSADPCDHKLAAQYFERARKNARQNRAPKDVRAKVLSQVAIYENTVLGQHENAARNFERATQLDDSFVDAWYELGRLRFAALEDSGGAVEAFESALRHAPTHLPCLVALAQILANSAARADVQRAETLFAQALELEPTNTRVLLSYAEFLANVSKADIRAESLYEQAIESAPEELRGVCRMRMGSFYEVRGGASADVSYKDKAIACYEAALRAPLPDTSTQAACLVSLGRCKADTGELEQARDILQKALATDASSLEAKWQLASVEQRCGRRGAAGKLFRAAFEEAPQDGHVLTHFAHFLLEYRGPTDERQLTVAESMLRKALESAAEVSGEAGYEPIALTYLGKLLARDPARRRQGVELLERAQRARPRDYDSCYALALVLSETVILTRAAIYRGREQREMQSTLERCVDLFVRASEVRESSVDAPLRASALLICLAEAHDDPLERQGRLERALKYGERAVRRAAKQQRKARSKPLTIRQAEAGFLCGVSLERQRRFGEALTNFLDAVALNPSHVLAMYHISRRKEIDLDDLEAAQRTCLEALQTTPATRAGKVDQAELCRRILHDYELAEARFMIVDGERDDPAAARALVMHQELAQKAQQLLDANSAS